MHAAQFRERLCQELAARRGKNPRYSLRALAAFLGTDHSTLSQILRGARPVPVSRIRTWAGKLGMDHEEALVYAAAEYLPEASTAERHEHLRQWTAEAISVATEPAHFQILRLCRTPEFRADSRWIAEQAGVDVDQVNRALSRLLRLRLLRVSADGEWMDQTGLPRLSERRFRKLALARIRETAAGA